MPFLGLLLSVLIGVFLAGIAAFTITDLATSVAPAPVTAPLVAYGAR